MKRLRKSRALPQKIDARQMRLSSYMVMKMRHRYPLNAERLDFPSLVDNRGGKAAARSLCYGLPLVVELALRYVSGQ